MQEKEIAVTNPKGIHARPSAMLVQAALECESTIVLIHGDKHANIRSVFDIMMFFPYFSVMHKTGLHLKVNHIYTENIKKIKKLCY